MKYSIFPKPFEFICPFSPDEVMKRLHDLIATSYPYLAKNGKPFKGRIDGYSFEMQKIAEAMRSDWSNKKAYIPLPVKIMGTVRSNDSGSIIHLTSRNKALFSILIFAAVSMLVSLIVFIFTSVIVFSLMIMVPSIVIALNFYQSFVDVARQQATLMLFFEGENLSDQ